MKQKSLLILIILMVTVFAANGQRKKKLNPAGTWKFEAPYAPEGYQTGTIIVGREDKMHTATMSFTGSEYKIPAQKVTFTRDSLFISVYLEGETIDVILGMESNERMSGKAESSSGDIPLTLTREDPPSEN